MHHEIRTIADRIKTKINDSSVIHTIEKRINTSHIDFLLNITCTFNLLTETHELLELNLFPNINQHLQLQSKKSDKLLQRSNGATLLGLAAFHGHIDIVRYLVEVQMANINAKDKNGNTPLHHVVYGDSYPVNHSSYGQGHDEIAKYLIHNGADISIKNNDQQTPYDMAKYCAPLTIEDMIGQRFITNTDASAYYADKIRPVLEKEEARQKNEPYTLAMMRHHTKDFNTFCLEQAIASYIKNNRNASEFANIEELYHALDTLSEEQWQHMRIIMSSHKPGAYKSRLELISDQLPKMSKQSIIFGMITTILAYYATQSILLSINTGCISAMLAWKYLTEAGYTQKINEREHTERRVRELQQHDRFFKEKPETRAQSANKQVPLAEHIIEISAPTIN